MSGRNRLISGTLLLLLCWSLYIEKFPIICLFNARKLFKACKISRTPSDCFRHGKICGKNEVLKFNMWALSSCFGIVYCNQWRSQYSRKGERTSRFSVKKVSASQKTFSCQAHCTFIHSPLNTYPSKLLNGFAQIPWPVQAQIRAGAGSLGRRQWLQLKTRWDKKSHLPPVPWRNWKQAAPLTPASR